MSGKNILIVSDRSHYFSFLGSQLEKDYGVYYIAVSKRNEEILQQKGKRFISWEALLTILNYKLEDVILGKEDVGKALFYDFQYDKLYNKSLNYDLIKKKGEKYSIEVAKLIETNNIDLVIVQNDLRSHASIPIAVARKKKIKTLIFEDGFFRPNTIVLDERGVNFNNSCPRERKFYEEIEIDWNEYNIFHKKEISKAQKHVINFFSEIEMPLNFGHILRLFRHPRRILRILSLIRNPLAYFLLRKDFILLPLQVRTDTQILCHSRIKHMEDFVNICLTHLEKYNRKHNTHLALVIKEHPRDPIIDQLRTVRKKHKNVISAYLSKADTRKLIEKSKAIITINSTVGIEGLLYYKPVITLGKAFYNIDGIVYPCQNFGKLDDLIEKAINNSVNKKLIDKFLYYLKYYYQVDGDLDNPDKENVQPVIERIRNAIG